MKRLVNRIRLFATFRYSDPSLHPGWWGWPATVGIGVMTQTVWSRRDKFKCHGSHQAVRCTIGPNMAHVDVCQCGKKRHGVFGSWC